MNKNENDDVIILNPDTDDDCTVFQTEEDRKRLEREILELEDDCTTGFNL